MTSRQDGYQQAEQAEQIAPEQPTGGLLPPLRHDGEWIMDVFNFGHQGRHRRIKDLPRHRAPRPAISFRRGLRTLIVSLAVIVLFFMFGSTARGDHAPVDIYKAANPSCADLGTFDWAVKDDNPPADKYLAPVTFNYHPDNTVTVTADSGHTIQLVIVKAGPDAYAYTTSTTGLHADTVADGSYRNISHVEVCGTFAQPTTTTTNPSTTTTTQPTTTTTEVPPSTTAPTTTTSTSSPPTSSTPTTPPTVTTSLPPSTTPPTTTATVPPPTSSPPSSTTSPPSTTTPPNDGSTTTQERLPDTGLGTIELAVIGALLVGFGAASVRSASRRRQSDW